MRLGLWPAGDDLRPALPALTGSGHGPAGSCTGRLGDRAGPPTGCGEPGRGKRRPDSALRLGGYLGRKLPGQVNRSAVWSVTEMEECLRWPLRGAVTAASQHRACTARPGGEPAVRKPRTVALSAGSPLAAGAAAAHDPPRPIQPGGRAKQRERGQRGDARGAESDHDSPPFRTRPWHPGRCGCRLPAGWPWRLLSGPRPGPLAASPNATLPRPRAGRSPGPPVSSDSPSTLPLQ